MERYSDTVMKRDTAIREDTETKETQTYRDGQI